jgi:hypothetical protein
LSKVPAQEVLAKVSDREKAKWAEANLDKLDFSCLPRDEAASKAKELVDYLAREG